MNFNEVILSLLPFTYIAEDNNIVLFANWSELSNAKQIDSVFVILLLVLFLMHTVNKFNKQGIILNNITSLLNKETFFIIGLFGMCISLYITLTNNIYQETISYSIASSISVLLWAIWLVILDKITTDTKILYTKQT